MVKKSDRLLSQVAFGGLEMKKYDTAPTSPIFTEANWNGELAGSEEEKIEVGETAGDAEGAGLTLMTGDEQQVDLTSDGEEILEIEQRVIMPMSEDGGSLD